MIIAEAQMRDRLRAACEAAGALRKINRWVPHFPIDAIRGMRHNSPTPREWTPAN